jgi:predicted AAA+ superfamily ATPase
MSRSYLYHSEVQKQDAYGMSSELKKRGSSPKIVPLNTALVNARKDSFPKDQDTEWMGRLFECAVGAEICRRYDGVTYWREGGAEVDLS